MIQTAGDLAYLVGMDFVKSANGAKPVYHLAGRLYLSGSGWLLMSVPNAMARGAFDALDEPGIELPTRDTDDPDAVFNAHVSVMSKDEVEQIGADNIHERGHTFRYSLGPVKTVEPKTWNGVSKVWYITVNSPELRQLRKSYGLSAQPKGDWDFHITIGIRKIGVLHANEKSKAAEERGPEGEYCPNCDARMEYDPDNHKCNSCGYEYVLKSAVLTLWKELADGDAAIQHGGLPLQC